MKREGLRHRRWPAATVRRAVRALARSFGMRGGRGVRETLEGRTPRCTGEARQQHPAYANPIDVVPFYVPPEIAEASWRAPEAAEIILFNGGAVIVRFGDETAFHSPTTDRLQIPLPAVFDTI